MTGKFKDSSQGEITMKKLMIIWMLSFFPTGFALQQHAATQIVVSKSVSGNGGDVLSNSEYRVVGTLGQPFIGITQNSSKVNRVGFWYLATHTVITDVDETSSSVPVEFRLEQNYPNPFNPTTTILFALPRRAEVKLKIYDLLGREVATLLDKELQPGEYKVNFEARGLQSGIYFYRIEASGFVQTRKLTLLK